MNCANHPDRERKAFCQNCGKPLCAECARTVGQAVFCEPCLELRLAAANAATGTPFAAGPPTGGTGYQAADGYQAVPGAAPFGGSASAPGSMPPPGPPNPGAALWLGFIPGVGAMYNGQYAKGVMHLIVFAVLISLADQNGIFGIFVAAWIVYQAFEAYHTARARRDGTPLPNPFGLNDIGERFGFGRSWPQSSSGGPFSAGAPVPPVAGFPPSSSTTGYAPPVDTPFQAPHPPYAAPPYTPPYAQTVGEPSSWGAPADGYGAPLPPMAPPPTKGSQFPVGALVLIGLGMLFLLGSNRMFVGLPLHYLLPVLLIGVGVYIFIRRLNSTGVGLVDDGTAAYRLRLVRALQSSVWVTLVGVLFLLDDLHILSWGRSWPLFIIVGGVMAFVQRSAYTAAAQSIPYTAYPPVAPQQPAASQPVPDPGTSIVPRDQEGS